MRGHCVDIISFSQGKNYEEFETNKMLNNAIIFSVLQIGELTKELDEKFRSNYNEVQWHKIYGLRNRLAHDYEGVSMLMI